MNKEYIFGVLIIVISIFAVYIEHQSSNKLNNYKKWKKDFGIKYSQEEDIFRILIFSRNIIEIEAHNANKNSTYKMGINQFTSMEDKEFAGIYLRSYPPSNIKVAQNSQQNYTPLVGDIDWTAKGKVSGVKNQGQCGSCWAFSATGVLESWSLIRSVSILLSEQQLVDCSRSQGNQGCNGGWSSNALNYVKSNGLSTQLAYPYVGKDQQCQTKGGTFRIAGQKQFLSCNNLQSGINQSPISVTVDATNWSKYSGGVFNNCGSTINHAVLLVGIIGGNWKIKNSWGTTWGQSGYIRLFGGNTCGICSYAGVVPQ